jgi:hypothetical protein
MSGVLLLALAEVLDAGSKRAAGWCYNTDAQIKAEVLKTMANKSRELGEELLAAEKRNLTRRPPRPGPFRPGGD